MAIIKQTDKLKLTQYQQNSRTLALLLNYTSDMQKIDTYLANLDTDLDNRFNTLSGDIASFKDSVQIEISNFESSINERIQGCEDLVLTYDDRIIDLERCCVEATNELNQHQEWLERIQSVIDTVSTANIEDLQRRLTAVEHKVDANAQLIATNLQYIQDIRVTLQSVDERLSNAEQRFVPIEADIEYLKSCCTLVQETLVEIQNSIDELFQKYQELKEQVDTNTRNIEANSLDIITVTRQAQINATNIDEIRRELNSIPNYDQLVGLITRLSSVETLLGTGELKTDNKNVIGAINELYDRPSSGGTIQGIYDGNGNLFFTTNVTGYYVRYDSDNDVVVFPRT